MPNLDIWRKGEHWRLHSQHWYSDEEKDLKKARIEAIKEAKKIRGKGYRAMVKKSKYWDCIQYEVYFTLPKYTKIIPNGNYRLRDTSVEIEKAAKELGSELALG